MAGFQASINGRFWVSTEGAIQQRDAADEGRLEPCGGIIFGRVIVDESEVVRPSQLIASVIRTQRRGDGGSMRTWRRVAVTVVSVLGLGCASEAGDWSGVKPGITTEPELLATFGSPDEVVATFPWVEWSARWKKRPLSTQYLFRYRVQYSSSDLLVGPGGKADDVEVEIADRKVLAVRWHYGGPPARAAAASLRGDPEIHFQEADSVSRGSKPLPAGLLVVDIGPRNSTLQVVLQLK
jgi:hypothetical protein